MPSLEDLCVSRCVVNIQVQACWLPVIPRRRHCSELKARFVEVLPKWQIGFFKIHFTSERRGISLFSLCWPFAVVGQDHSCWETIFWSCGGSLAAWPECGKTKASFLKGSSCTLLSSFPRDYFEVLHLKQSRRLCHTAITEALLTLQETSEKQIKTSTDLFPR